MLRSLLINDIWTKCHGSERISPHWLSWNNNVWRTCRSPRTLGVHSHTVRGRWSPIEVYAASTQTISIIVLLISIIEVGLSPQLLIPSGIELWCILYYLLLLMIRTSPSPLYAAGWQRTTISSPCILLFQHLLREGSRRTATRRLGWVLEIRLI